MIESEWVTTTEAAEIAGVRPGSIRQRARRGKWAIEYRKREAPSSGPDLWLFRRSDIEAYAYERANGLTVRRSLRPRSSEYVRGLVEWADELDEWPPDEEIAARITDAWSFEEIEGVIDCRVYPGRGRLPALRKPAMKLTEGRRRER